ncbi:MAG: hypothetical protein HY899_16690 [Deltaproteobacteria bacterium]|nr:hypothetical protein [Deltaproteobacteria bacterium]
MPSDSFSFSHFRVRRTRHHRRAAAAAVAGAIGLLLLPDGARAFVQQTTVEGPIGGDIGGVWLSVQQIVPEFRVQYPRPAEGRPVPFKVGPIPADLEPLVGKNPKGVVVTELLDAGKCAEFSIMAGDIVRKLNSTDVADVAAFEQGLQSLPQSVVLTIRRPAIRMTTARLIKIKYSVSKGGSEAISAIGGENADIQVLDVRLPFADKLDETRRTHQLWQAAAADIESLAGSWPTLPVSDPPLFMRGQHRLVAASDYDESLSGDEGLKGTKHALLVDLDGNPVRGASGGKIVDVYGFESMTPQRIEGSYVTVSMASAPFPINVEFKGRFVMTRVADWSDKDDQLRKAAAAEKKPKEDLDSYKLAPEVPEAPKAPAPAAP